MSPALKQEKHGFFHSRQSLIYLVVAVLLASNGWLLYSRFSQVKDAEGKTTHTLMVISELETLLSSIKGAETSTRGFLLSRDEAHLQSYRRGVAESIEHLEKLRSLASDNPGQSARLDGIGALVQERFQGLERLADPTQVYTTTDLRHHLAAGKATMDELREQIREAKSEELRLLEARQTALRDNETYFRWALLFTTAVSLLVVTVAFTQFRRGEMKKHEDTRLREIELWRRDALKKATMSISGDLGMEQAIKQFLAFLSNELGVLAARVYLQENGGLKLFGEIGVAGNETDRNNPNTRGLLMQAFAKEDAWKVTSVPENYWHIGSSFGSSLPTEILFLPISFQNRKLGVLELATFEPLNEHQLELFENMREPLGVGLNAAKTRVELQEYLETVQQQAEELQAQQEELRTNNEELEQQARALESHQQSMALKNRELEVARRGLEEKATDLLKSNQYKSEFLAKMSHELRTPLNGLLILSTLLMENKEDNLTEQQRQFIKSINTAGHDLLILINDILDLSKIEAKKLVVRPEEFTVEDLLSHKKTNFTPQARAKGLKLNVILDDELKDAVLNTDRLRLEQILRNFLSNAIKFTEKGSVTLKATPIENSFIEFSVKDTGIGIPENKKNLIFEAFEQADGSVSRKFGGTGLGLTISRELASLLGGVIDLRSEEGQGSTFYLRIPMNAPLTGDRASEKPRQIARNQPQPSPMAPSQTAEHAQQKVDAIRPNTKTILIVEDDDKFRLSVSEVVKSYGFQPVEAETAEIALNILDEHTPTAILLDIKLPGMSGLGFLEMIKHTPHLRHIPVHMISALDFQHSALRMGAMGYLSKPVTIEKIKSAMERIESVVSQKVRKVLLIEDDKIQNQAVSQLISGSDVEVISAHDGASAIEKVKSEAFDCIILDLSLPDVSGFDVLSALSNLNRSLPPIVIYTGKDLTSEEEEHLRRYSESIIIKGARSPGRLLDEVNLFLHRVENLLPEEQQKILSSSRKQEATFEGKKVLVVDDDLRNVFALTSALESKGLEVSIAKNGVEALEALENETDIDIVLMDIMMPKMDGFEATRRIRASKNTRIRDIPVIALTAKAMREDQEKCIEAGATDYLPKPVNLNNLSTLLKVWLAPKDLF